MFFRAIALSIALLVGFGAVVIVSTDYSEASAKLKKKKRKQRAKYKKYSKKWWRAYNQRMERKRAIAKRKRALRLRQIRLAKAANIQVNNTSQKSNNKANKDSFVADSSSPALLPTGETAPKGWRRGQVTSNSELQFRVDDDTGSQIGLASIAVVGPAAAPSSNNNPKNKTVGGIMTSALRGTVIDRMIKEEGWVVNDFQKEISGKKVYVVVAQSPGAGGTLQSRMFYFTEVDGKIYSVATTAPNNSSERIVQESEKVIDSLMRPKNNPQQAGLK
jgi:predicted Zn-dependent protease